MRLFKHLFLAGSMTLAVTACGIDVDGDTPSPSGENENSPQSTESPASAPSDIGAQCEGNADCSTRSCVFAGDADFGYCTKICESFSDCPTFWNCEVVGNASQTYCMK